MVSANISTS
ncbi:hypothetical protein D018_0137A, partial [Vibrio parahaemolyticus VP2007-007]